MATSTKRIPTVAPFQFVRETTAELKKVTWPTREETIKLTLVVITVSLLVGAFVGGLDVLLTSLTQYAFK